MRGAECAGLRQRVNGGIDGGEMIARGTESFAPIDPELSARVVAEKDVLGDCQMRTEVQLLRSDGDPCAAGINGRNKIQGRAIPAQLALGRPQLAADDVHECALAGAILTGHRVHLMGPYIDADVPQGVLRPEPLGEISPFEMQLASCWISSHPRPAASASQQRRQIRRRRSRAPLCRCRLLQRLFG